MNTSINEIDARILELLQREIPLTREPFRDMGNYLSLDPSEVISRIARCKQEGFIRRLGAVVDPGALGYKGALVALEVVEDRLDAIGEAIGQHEKVSHCYSRDASYNLWFTFTVPPDGDLDSEIKLLTNQDGVESCRILPALRVFKLAVILQLTDSPPDSFQPIPQQKTAGAVHLSEADKTAIRVLQDDPPLSDRPFEQLALKIGWSENELLNCARDLIARGIIRRYAAVLNHRKVGYTHNAMVCWKVERDRIENTGCKLARDWTVSHCYERPAFPDWPYSIYTMVHGRNESELGDAVARLSGICCCMGKVILRTLKEYKKSSVRYLE